MLVRRLLPALLFALLPVIAGAAAPGVYAITGGTVHPVSGGEIANGIVVIRDGLIEAVGASVPIPPDATTIDATGLHVYPGLIDAQTSFGFPSPAPTTRRRGGRGAAAVPPAETPQPDTSPAYIALHNVKLSDDDAESLRGIGVTTIATVPSSGIFNGQSAVLNLGGGPVESQAIKSPASIQVSFNTRPAWTYPDSLMGVIAYIRQTLLDAQQYAAARAIYDKAPAGVKRPPDDASLAALAPVLRGELPVVFVADTELMMRRAQRIAKEMNVKYALAGARQAYRMADDLKRDGVPVLVSVKWPAPPTSKEDRDEQPLRVIRDHQLSPTSPATLAKSGVVFALVSGTGKTGDYIPGIRKAIENGLTADDALRATTLWPARILGIDRQLGSLERGKIANVVLTDKPIFVKEAKVKRVFIDGRETKLPSEEDKEKAKGETASGGSSIDGAWSISVRMPQGDVALTASLHAEEGKLTGTYAGDAGSGDIRGGTFDGTTVELTITAKVQGSETGDWVFHGTLADGKLSGTVSTPLGTQSFTGRKTQ